MELRPLANRSLEVASKAANRIRLGAVAVFDVLDGYFDATGHDVPLKKSDDEKASLLSERRRENLENPDYLTLLWNKWYSDWIAGNLSTHEYDNRPHEFEKIKNGTLPESVSVEKTRWFDSCQERIDPDLLPEDIKKMCLDYSDTNVGNFIQIATDISARHLEGDVTDRGLISHIYHLLGHGDHTIFLNMDWSTINFTPKFTKLGIDAAELDQDIERIFTAVELGIGLWVKAADKELKRPMSQSNFAPVFDHCSFHSLVYDTGWNEHRGKTDEFLKASYNAEARNNFLAPFRASDFCADINERLTN